MGTYSVMTGSAALKDCLPAPPGNYAEGTGNDGFVPCPAGTFQNLPGQGACKVGGLPGVLLCDGWQRAALARQTASMLHPAHALLPASSSGSLSPSHFHAPSSASLQPCPPGFACPRASVKAKPCAAGFYADMKQPFCRECPRGSYQNMPQQRACKVG